MASENAMGEEGEEVSEKWDHSICDDCWNTLRPKNKSNLMGWSQPDWCCWCSKLHRSGIFMRNDPEELRCRGDHSLRLVRIGSGDIVFQALGDEK